MRTTLVSHGNILVAPVIGWVLCAPKYLVGTMSLGEAAQAVAAFVMVQTALNWLVDNYPGLAVCLSSVNRVGSLLVALDEFDRDDAHPRWQGPGCRAFMGVVWNSLRWRLPSPRSPWPKGLALRVRVGVSQRPRTPFPLGGQGGNDRANSIGS